MFRPGSFQGELSGIAHVGNLQLFQDDDSVVFADIFGDFLEVVVASIGDLYV